MQAMQYQQINYIDSNLNQFFGIISAKILQFCLFLLYFMWLSLDLTNIKLKIDLLKWVLDGSLNKSNFLKKYFGDQDKNFTWYFMENIET